MNKKNCVIFTRIANATDRQSVDSRVSNLNAFASKNEINVIKIFEEYISGVEKNEERPVLCECLDYCIENKIDILLINDLSRLGRKVDEIFAIMKRCMDNNLNIYFLKENLSLFHADGTKNSFQSILIKLFDIEESTVQRVMVEVGYMQNCLI